MRLTDGLQMEKKEHAKTVYRYEFLGDRGSNDFLSLSALGEKNYIFYSVLFYFSFTVASC